jgi:hypothetical protein
MAALADAYRCEPAFRDAFLALARECADRRLIGRHYLHLGERQRRTYFGDGKDVALKKLFYALRPAAALRWLRLHPQEAVPPMHFPTLLAESDPPPQTAALAAELETGPVSPSAQARAKAEAFFRGVVRACI